MNVLLLTSGDGVRDELGGMLGRCGFAVDQADPRSADTWLSAGKSYALVLLDTAPAASARAAISAVRHSTDAPLLVLTQRDSLNDRLEGLALGATEYMVKPCAPADVLECAWTLASRGHPPKPGVQRLADLVVDRERGKAFRRGVDLQLSATLFELLDVLMAHKGQVLSRAELIKAVWGSNAEERDNMVTVGILRLRHKLDDPFGPKLIHTVRGEGYVLALDR